MKIVGFWSWILIEKFDKSHEKVYLRYEKGAAMIPYPIKRVDCKNDTYPGKSFTPAKFLRSLLRSTDLVQQLGACFLSLL